jgi:hypothetical protein
MRNGWQSLDSAPRNQFVLLLYMTAGKAQSAVGSYSPAKRCWCARVPHSSDLIEIYARKWHPLPPLPSVEF